MFKKNTGNMERFIRIALGIVVLSLALTIMSGVVQWIVLAVSVVFFVTGIAGFCPLYTIIGLATNKKDFCPTCNEQEMR